MISPWTLLHILPILALLYYYVHKKYSYWSDRGVPGPRPIFPFGYFLHKAILRPNELEVGLVRKYGKTYGVYTGLLPTLTITDPELIKQMMIKDFGTVFINRRALNTLHDIWNLNLFHIESENWKRIRAITSASFSSAKLKGMYSFMGGCLQKLDNYFEKKTKGDGIIETKEVMAGFTIDVIALSAFATETNANDEREKKSPFVYHGLNIFCFPPLKVALALTLPRPILQALNITSFFPAESLQFFVDLTSKIVEQRMSGPQSVKRNDLVQLMIDSFAYEDDLASDNYDKLAASMDDETKSSEAHSNLDDGKVKKKLTKKEIIAQCIIFFIAGFETTASTLGHCLFELARNPEVQERLNQEVNQHLEGCDPNDTNKIYDILLNNVHYLDAVFKETLRLYPPVFRLERRVGADGVKLGGIPLDKNILVEVPSYVIQRDPEHWPNPDQFNPERFLPENKHLLVPYTYMPFGLGPRNCVGMRFAYQEAKLCLGMICRRFRFEPISSTPSKLSFRRGGLLLNCEPFKLKVSLR